MYNARNRRAANHRQPWAKPARLRSPGLPAVLLSAFAHQVAISPQRGSVACTSGLQTAPTTTLATALGEPPSRSARARPAPRPKLKRAHRRRRLAVKPRCKPLAIALMQRSAPLAEPTIDLAAWSALAPPQPTLVPLPTPPLTRSPALPLDRGGGIIAALAERLSAAAQEMWCRLGGVEWPRPKHQALPGLILSRRIARPEDEMRHLKIENQRLRLQLEALLALQSGASGNQTASPA